MRCLIRFLSRGPTGSLQTRDRLFDGDELTLGRATDQVLHLKDRRVALQHARLVRREGQLVVQALSTAGVLVNGSVRRESRLLPGDELRIGANILRIIEPDVASGAAFAFSFELDPEARAEEAQTAPVPRRLSETGLGMRAWSWLLFLGILLGALLIPASGLFDPEWQATLRESPLPDDRLWLSGPLADPHQIVNASCEACHQQPFVQVRDSACLDCHASHLREHAPELGGVLAAVRRSSCTDCHREHDGTAWLVRQDDALCATCHRDLPALAGARYEHRPATDFLRDHPPFRVTTVQAAPGALSGSERVVQRGLPGPAFTDPSGLIFPHELHLDPAGLEVAGGPVVLDCGDCHQPDAGGARFAPVQMTAHCADCHRLDFDPAEPERQVPHGPIERVLTTLDEFYARRYLEEFADPLATARPAAGQRRPGPPLTAAAREAALERARAQAELVARDLIERRSCANCHEISVDEGAPPAARWRLQPVVLTTAWMPAARFSHQAHGTSLTPCASCHAAATSGTSADILMPEITVCRDCHAGSSVPRGASNLLASGCATCHSFHQDTAPLWHQTSAAWPAAGADQLLRWPAGATQAMERSGSLP